MKQMENTCNSIAHALLCILLHLLFFIHSVTFIVIFALFAINITVVDYSHFIWHFVFNPRLDIYLLHVNHVTCNAYQVGQIQTTKCYPFPIQQPGLIYIIIYTNKNKTVNVLSFN